MASITAPQLTIEEFSRFPGDCERHEMSAGELITMPPPRFVHNRVARKVFKALETFLDKSAIGEAYAEAGYVLSREPLTIREPDVSFLSKGRIDATDPDGYVQRAPELAVEIISPSDSAEDLETKVQQYLESGAKQVWVLYPKAKRVHVFYATEQRMVLDEAQMLEGGDLLPGFSVKVADLFVS